MNSSEQNCPYCGCKMEQGTFQSRGGNYFLPDGEKRPSLYEEKAMEKRNAILLPPDCLSAGKKQWPVAYVCRNCKKMIIPYE